MMARSPLPTVDNQWVKFPTPAPNNGGVNFGESRRNKKPRGGAEPPASHGGKMKNLKWQVRQIGGYVIMADEEKSKCEERAAGLNKVFPKCKYIVEPYGVEKADE